MIERSLAWLVGYRRLQVRYERHADILLGFLHLACALICLKSFDIARRRGPRGDLVVAVDGRAVVGGDPARRHGVRGPAPACPWRLIRSSRVGPLAVTRKLALGGKRAEDAELVAFRISEHDPLLRPLPHVGMASSQTDKPLHLGLLRAVDRADV